MKKIFTLIAVLISITTFAAPGPRTSKISISNNDRSMMQVKIDGVMYNLDNTFVLDNIRSGNHTIAIYKMQNVFAGGFRKTTTMIYSNSMYISPAQLINIDINRNGKVVVKTTTNDRYNRDDRNRGNDRDYNDRYDNDRNDSYDKNNGRNNNNRRY